MNSIWSEIKLPGYPALNEDKRVNTLIIGGGLAGILTAYRLKERGVECAVIEAKTICSGQTKNTTAKITSQHNVIYSKIEKYYGEEYAKQYALANEGAITDYETIINERDIDCGFKRTNAVLYTNRSANELSDEYLAAKSAGIDCYKETSTALPFSVTSALVFKNQAQFHPLKFVNGILEGLEIYENTRAIRIEGKMVITPVAKIIAEHIVVATHYPFINFPGAYFLKMSQERSYVVAFDKEDFELDGMYYGIDNDGLSFRNYGSTVILGGGSHRTGAESRPESFNMLENKAKELFGGVEITSRWSAQDCVPLDEIPYIGRFIESSPNIFVATGFNKWGITSSMVSANIISDMICGRANENAEVFSPQRLSFCAVKKNFIENTGETLLGFASHLVPSFCGAESVEKGSAKEIMYGGNKAGAYRDTDGKLYIVTLRCPHLKCKLKFNSVTKTWDCPCHGSRYDYKGNLIDNPAQKESILIDII